MNKKTLCILLCLCSLFTITADASDSQLNMNERKLVLHQEFKYENGKLSYSKEYEYDSHGRVIKSSSYYSYGAARQYFDYKYDENDNIISTLQSSNYDEDAYCEYQHDSHGNMLQSTLYYNGKIYQCNYEYDTHGNLLLKTETEKSESNPDIILTKQECHTYTYDEQGNMTQMTETTGSSQCTYEYDTQGNLIRKMQCRSAGIYQDDYEYDSLGNMILQTTYDPDKNITRQTKYEYDGQDNLVQETAYDSEGDMIYQIKYKYDGQNNLIHQIDYDSEGDITEQRKSKYDEQGRIIADYSSHPYYGYNYKYRYEYTWITIE